MQSKIASLIECIVKTFATGSAAALANYYLLPAWWTLPPTVFGSVTMALWFGAQSVVVSYPIRRFFNAIR